MKAEVSFSDLLAGRLEAGAFGRYGALCRASRNLVGAAQSGAVCRPPRARRAPPPRCPGREFTCSRVLGSSSMSAAALVCRGCRCLIARPRWRGVLLEPRQKRWAFLKLVIRELGLDAEAVDRRYEELDAERRYDLVTMRAVGGRAAVLDWARPRLVDGGGVALWTTVEGERELAEKVGWRVLSWPASRPRSGPPRLSETRGE